LTPRPAASRGKRRRWINRSCLAAGLLLGSPLVAPQLLAFPHHAVVGAHPVYSEQPIGPELVTVIRAADAAMLRDTLGRARPLDQPLFFTDGGWRWTWLSVSSFRSFALSRPLGEPVIVNRSDPARDQMANGGRPRRLSHVVAHELAHGAIRAHFGQLAALRMPRELVEGYADHVAGSSTLSDDEAKALIREGREQPALIYWTGRKKVDAALARNGGSVDRLFAEWR
jgi:hypothetical protein